MQSKKYSKKVELQKRRVFGCFQVKLSVESIETIFRCCRSGSVWISFILVCRIRIQLAKNQPNSWKFPHKSTKIIKHHTFFFKTIKLMFTDIYIYPLNNKINHISENHIFYRKKRKTKVDVFPGRIWSRIRYLTKRIRGSGSIS